MLKSALNILIIADDLSEVHLITEAISETLDGTVVYVLDLRKSIINSIGEYMGSKSPDGIIIGSKLSNRDGLDIITLLSSDSRFADVPIVIISASSDPDLTRRCKQSGAKQVHQKPKNFIEYVALVRGLVSLFQSAKNGVKLSTSVTSI